MKAHIRVGFDGTGVPSHAILMTDEKHIEVDKKYSTSYADIQIEGQKHHIKDIWAEGILNLMTMNATKAEIKKIQKAYNEFSNERM